MWIAPPVEPLLDLDSQIGLVDEYPIGFFKRQGIFVRLVAAFGDRCDKKLDMLADHKLSRAYQVADVFNKQEAAVKVKCLRRLLDQR